MPFAALDDQFHSNPKVIAMGLDGAGLYSRALSYCADYITDGFVPAEWVKAIVGRKTAIARKLIEVGAWHEVGPLDTIYLEDKSKHAIELSPTSKGFVILDYVKFNPSSIELQKRKQERSFAGRKGAIKRWTDSNTHGNSHTENDGNSHTPEHGNSHGSSHPPRARAHACPLPLPQEALASSSAFAVNVAAESQEDDAHASGEEALIRACGREHADKIRRAIAARHPSHETIARAIDAARSPCDSPIAVALAIIAPSRQPDTGEEPSEPEATPTPACPHCELRAGRHLPDCPHAPTALRALLEHEAETACREGIPFDDILPALRQHANGVPPEILDELLDHAGTAYAQTAKVAAT